MKNRVENLKNVAEEIEGSGGRDYELQGAGAGTQSRFLSAVAGGGRRGWDGEGGWGWCGSGDAGDAVVSGAPPAARKVSGGGCKTGAAAAGAEPEAEAGRRITGRSAGTGAPEIASGSRVRFPAARCRVPGVLRAAAAALCGYRRAAALLTLQAAVTRTSDCEPAPRNRWGKVTSVWVKVARAYGKSVLVTDCRLRILIVQYM
ncbi:uncharacterized protein LOC124805616 [Schistocerca piceifrons]|uniref:uncharacterized protein LOC124805616 n=1 Tax=Schistocerca piceifrons TaxID=274613 RepID=UPI001F5EC021|nr:uncharacterized protein LOC124805616 [Schistocerca piceifrons]